MPVMAQAGLASVGRSAWGLPPDLRPFVTFSARLTNSLDAFGAGPNHSATYSGGAVTGAGAVLYADDPLGTGLLTARASGVPQFTSQGYQSLGAIENLCLYSCDFTQAAWTASNVTAAMTSVGPDGAANSACRLTATAANGTMLQAITSASAARITFMYVKRITGTGNIDITQDNGSTWTTVTTTAAWTKVNLTAATAANPTVGIRIVADTDAVDVWGFTHAKIAFAYPGHLQTQAVAASRTGDVLTYPVAGNINSAVGTTAVTGMYSGPLSGVAPAMLAISSGSAGFFPYQNFAANRTTIRTYDGTTVAVSPVGVDTSTAPVRGISTWGTAGLFAGTGGILGAGGAFDGDLNVGTAFTAGATSSPTNLWWGTLRRIVILSTQANGDASRLSTQP